VKLPHEIKDARKVVMSRLVSGELSALDARTTEGQTRKSQLLLATSMPKAWTLCI
jgi:hypothetical protein